MIRFTSPRIRRPTDRRYGTRRWRRLRADVVAASNGRCYGEGCTRLSRVADHIIPVYPGMPDGAFFGRANLRASCQGHNAPRQRAVTLQREAGFFTTQHARKALTRSSISPNSGVSGGNLLLAGDYSRNVAE